MYTKAATDNEKIINETIFLYHNTNLSIRDSLFAAEKKIKHTKPLQPKRHLLRPVREYVGAFYDLDNYTLSKDLKLSLEEIEWCKAYLKKNNLIEKYSKQYWSD